MKELAENNFRFSDTDAKSVAMIENQLPPEIPDRNKFDEISLDLVKVLCRETELNFIKYLNLFNNNLKRIENLDSLSNLTTLVLSFNEIKKIEGVAACS